MSDPAPIPAQIIAQLGLEPHPEGGWYRQTWRAETATEGKGGRPTATAIYFLLEEHQRSHWHRVDGAELWFWHAGAPVALLTAPGDRGPVTRTVLGSQVLEGEAGQALVPTGHWQASEPIGGWALVSCVVSPGFHFGGFELAAPGWAPGQTPGVPAQR